ncbi:MAG: DUF2063 domain-containing protein, partial [Lysobacteraceae bacterium]
LQDQLHAFAAHLRDPAAHAGPPGVDPGRLEIYARLLHGTLDSLLAGTFPVLRETVGDADWHALLRGFRARHRSQTPLFTRVGLEFVAFLEGECEAGSAPPWSAELAQYEWAELGLQQSDASAVAHDPSGDLLEGIPVLSPLAWPLAYRWPVDRIGPGRAPALPGQEPTLILLRRDANGRVHFSRISPLLFRLLELIGANEHRSGRELLRQLAGEAGQADFDGFLREAVAMLERLHDEGVVPGTRL